MSLQVSRNLEPPKSPKLFRTQRELSKGEESKVTGKLPEWLKGTYLRVGPGKFDFAKDFAVEHFMDGYALLSKFEVDGRNGTVKFEKKFLESDAYKKALVAQKPVIGEFGTKPSSDPTKSFFKKLIPSLIPELSDNGNISLFNIGRDVFASGETCFFRDLDPETLQSGKTAYDTNKMFGLQIASAHPLTDDTGYTYNVGCSILTGLKYNVIKIPPVGPNESVKDAFKKSKILASIPTSHSSYLGFMHSFGMTKNYIILIEQPYVLNASKVVGSVLAKSTAISSWLEWKPELKNKFFIIEKESGKVLKADVISEDPFFFLHIINCFEINDHIVIDLTAFPNANSLTVQMNLEKLRRLSLNTVGGGNDNPCGERYVIPLVDLDECKEGENLVTIKTEATAEKIGNQLVLNSEVVTEKGLELPMINKKFLAKKTSFYYATGSATKGFFENSICKVHTSAKNVLLWRESEHYFLGEPMFVHNPEGTDEDDGIIISAVTDNSDAKAQDFLLFLQAATMKEIGRCYFKEEIPYAVHGLFLPDESKPKKK